MSDLDEDPWERRARKFGPLLIAACGLLAYADSFTAPFVFDGDNYLKQNKAIQTIWPLDQLWNFAQTRPVGYFSFALNYQLGRLLFDNGYELASWHATNLAIHVAAACALFGIARRTLQSPRLAGTFGPSAARVALAIAVVWVVHPLNTQSVTYLYQRLESLMGMFYLLTLYCFIRYTESYRLAWSAASVACCLLATETKEVAVTAPLMIVWYDSVFVARDVRELLRRRGWLHTLLFASLAFPLVMMWWMAGTHKYQSAGILDTSRVTVLQYVRTQPEVVLHYLRLAYVPWPLNIDYSWKIRSDWNYPALLLCGGLVALTAWAAYKRPALGFLGGWWFVILAPTSSIAPIIDMAFEHRTYLSLIAPIALAVGGAYWGIGKLTTRCGGDDVTVGDVRAALLLVVVALLTTMTLLRNYDYRSEVSIWRDVVEKSPHNSRAQYNYGVYLQLAAPPQLDDAIRQYHRTLELDPAYADAHLNLGNLAVYRADWPTAKEHFERLLELHFDDKLPHYRAALYGIAQADEQLGDELGARVAVERLLEVDPEHADGKALQARITPTATPSASR